MRIVRPYAVQDADLTTNATESASAWSGIPTYSIGNQVLYSRYVYEAVRENFNKQPDTSPDDWLQLRPSNVWAMFDDRTGTQTTRTSPLEVSVDTDGYVDTLGLLNITGNQLVVTVNDGINPIFTETINLFNEDAITDYYEYFFEPIIPLTDIVVSLPPDVYAPTVSIELIGTGTVAVGQMVLGQSYVVSDKVHWGAQLSGTDYSRVETDEFGENTFIVQRAYNRTGRFTFTIEKERTDAVYNILTGYRATPVLVIGLEQYSSSFYYGLLRDVVIEIAYPKYNVVSLEVRGI